MRPSPTRPRITSPIQRSRSWGRPSRAQQPGADQGEHREAEHQTSDHGHWAALAPQPLPVGPEAGGRSGPRRHGPGCGSRRPGRRHRRARRRSSRTGRRRADRYRGRLGRGLGLLVVGIGPVGGPGDAGGGRIVLQAARRAGGEDHRNHGQDARRDARDQASEEPDEHEGDHGESLSRPRPGRSSARPRRATGAVPIRAITSLQSRPGRDRYTAGGGPAPNLTRRGPVGRDRRPDGPRTAPPGRPPRSGRPRRAWFAG